MQSVEVKIQRGVGCRVPRTVYDFEVPVLRAIHGDGNVTVGASKDVPKAQQPTPQQAWDMMKAKYDTKDGEASLEQVYRNLREFESVLAEGIVLDEGKAA